VKVNQAGVVPVIFASSLLEMPQLAVSVFGHQDRPQGWVAMLPLVALDKIGLGQDVQLSGVSLLIMVSVGLDTVKQIQSQLEQHSYQGFWRERKFAGTRHRVAALNKP
jgi:preprotein translocase subunit SecY